MRTEKMYQCQVCDEPLPEESDTVKGQNPCQQCGNTHSSAVQANKGGAGLFAMLTAVLCLTLVGIIVAPITGVISYVYYRRASKLLEQDEHRIGHEV